MTKSEREIFLKAIDVFGSGNQVIMVMEEMNELGKELCKTFRESGAPIDNICEEIADVEIMLDQLKLIVGEKNVTYYRKKKIKRLKERLDTYDKSMKIAKKMQDI